ncbi:unnamed protein product [Echinostoma caproni]|uniref:Tubulin domain-containing protein n=1 Tax=Echinostoma caproni TaxID=27848 RepID=A0A183ADB0_9TREM|nr:unnamed protein product [Echinostoma caproni]
MKPEPDTDSLFVIGAGCGGTGTATLKAALEILFNKPCYDLTTLVRKHPDHVRKWIELDERLTDDRAEEGDSIDPQTVRDIFRGYSCAMDFPAISYYWQLLHIYPNAKVSYDRLAKKCTAFDTDGALFRRLACL